VQIGAAAWTSVSAGSSATCGIQPDGSLWCWGSNAAIGTGMPQQSPRRVDMNTWSMVSVGIRTTCAIRTTGELYCWGQQYLGDSAVPSSNTPIQIGTSTWTRVSASGYHQCGIQLDGSLWCWGLNVQNAVAETMTYAYDTPIRVGTRNDWVDVATTENGTCMRATNGSVECYGNPLAIGAGLAWSSVFVPVVR
jgi:alpha-tubulin suppressor-like RCC1 family protein